MEGGNGNEKNLPLEPRSGSILIAVGFNPRSKSERNYAVRQRRTETLRSVHSKTTQPKTFSGCSPSSGYNLTAQAVKKCGSLQKSHSQNWQTAPLVRGRFRPPKSLCPEERLSSCRKPYWIADVSPPKNLSRKERKETIGANTD